MRAITRALRIIVTSRIDARLLKCHDAVLFLRIKRSRVMEVGWKSEVVDATFLNSGATRSI